MPPVYWTQKQDIGPSPRAGHAMAYDQARQRVVVFGGDPGSGLAPLADTWHWDGSLWTQVADMGPSGRHGHALAAYPELQQTLLFGGAAGGAFLGDTWGWDATEWSQVADTGPSPRAWHAMALDAWRGRVVLFGGRSATGMPGDTWEWDGVEWTQVQDQGPSARSTHVMAFDPSIGRVILFGGADDTGQGLADTWAWDGTNWTQVADMGPEPRANASLVGGAMLLFGGVPSVDPSLAPNEVHPFGDTWRWDGHGWTKVQDMGPAARWGHAMAFRFDVGRVVLFGGTTVDVGPAQTVYQLLADTWEVAGTGPQPPAPSVGIQVATVTVDAPIASNMVGEAHLVTVTLDGPAPQALSLSAQIVYFAQGNPIPAVPSGFDLPQLITVGPQATMTSFAITKTADPLATGQYAVSVVVQAAGAIPQLGPFTVV